MKLIAILLISILLFSTIVLTSDGYSQERVCDVDTDAFRYAMEGSNRLPNLHGVNSMFEVNPCLWV